MEIDTEPTSKDTVTHIKMGIVPARMQSPLVFCCWQGSLMSEWAILKVFEHVHLPYIIVISKHVLCIGYILGFAEVNHTSLVSYICLHLDSCFNAIGACVPCVGMIWMIEPTLSETCIPQNLVNSKKICVIMFCMNTPENRNKITPQFGTKLYPITFYLVLKVKNSHVWSCLSNYLGVSENGAYLPNSHFIGNMNEHDD